MDNVEKILFESNGNLDPAISGLADSYHAGAQKFVVPPVSGVEFNAKSAKSGSQESSSTEEETSASEEGDDPARAYKNQLKTMITQYKDEYIQSLRNGFRLVLGELNTITQEVESGQLDATPWVVNERSDSEEYKEFDPHAADTDDDDDDDDELFGEGFGGYDPGLEEDMEEDYKG